MRMKTNSVIVPDGNDYKKNSSLVIHPQNDTQNISLKEWTVFFLIAFLLLCSETFEIL